MCKKKIVSLWLTKLKNWPLDTTYLNVALSNMIPSQPIITNSSYCKTEQDCNQTYASLLRNICQRTNEPPNTLKVALVDVVLRCSGQTGPSKSSKSNRLRDAEAVAVVAEYFAAILLHSIVECVSVFTSLSRNFTSI